MIQQQVFPVQPLLNCHACQRPCRFWNTRSHSKTKVKKQDLDERVFVSFGCCLETSWDCRLGHPLLEPLQRAQQAPMRTNLPNVVIGLLCFCCSCQINPPLVQVFTDLTWLSSSEFFSPIAIFFPPAFVRFSFEILTLSFISSEQTNIFCLFKKSSGRNCSKEKNRFESNCVRQTPLLWFSISPLIFSKLFLCWSQLACFLPRQLIFSPFKSFAEFADTREAKMAGCL